MVTKRFFSIFFYRMQEKDIQQSLERLGARIKELRLARGYTNYETFAYKHDLPRAQYGRYEKGSDLRFTSLIKVIEALGVTPEEFFRGF